MQTHDSVDQERGGFPFGQDFEKVVLRMLCEDMDFAVIVGPHLQPGYFSAEPFQWAFSFIVRYMAEYRHAPTVGLIKDQAHRIPETIKRDLFAEALDQVAVAPLKDAEFIRDQVLEFVKCNMFVRAFNDVRTSYNQGSFNAAFDLMRVTMDKIQNVGWKQQNESFLALDLEARHLLRQASDPQADAVPTGFNWLDQILDGGLSPGEVGLWIAPQKVGKTTMLINLGIGAVRVGRKRTAHFVLEGLPKQIIDRYDAGFVNEAYGHIKSGSYSDEVYKRMLFEYQQMGNKLHVCGMSDSWDYSILNIDSHLRRLRDRFQWEAECIIIDYGDLLNGRHPPYKSETEKQRHAYQDIKTLAVNGAVPIWTAAQAQRGDKDSDTKPYVVKATEIADSFAKARIVDFYGSINRTQDEKAANQMRVYAEAYRSAPANVLKLMAIDPQTLRILEREGLKSVHDAAQEQPRFPQQMRGLQ